MEEPALGQAAVKEDQTNGLVKITSFCLLERVASVFSSLDEEKQTLVRSIGFEGLLSLPCVKNIDANFSLWLLKHLDRKKMSLKTTLGEVPIKDVDAHFVLGIPFIGGKVIDDNEVIVGKGSGPKYDSEVVSKVRSLLFQDKESASFTLDYLQDLITRDYGVGMSKEQKVSFKIAVVLFSMGTFFAVYQTRYWFPIWLLRNFTNPDKIGDINWSGYVLSILELAAKKVQSKNIQPGSSINLYGCTFLLQVFYLDNLELRKFKTLQMDLPRVAMFKEELLQKMVEIEKTGKSKIGLLEYGKHKFREASEVCYSRGWGSVDMQEWEKNKLKFKETTDHLHHVLQNNTELAPVVVDAIRNWSDDAAMATQLSYSAMYPGYIPSAEPCYPKPKRVIANVSELLSPGQIVKNVINNHKSGRKKQDFLKKEVFEHSNFDMSPFQLWWFHPDVPRSKKMLVYDWIKEGHVNLEELATYWFQHNVPSPVTITGLEIKSSFQLSGHFSISVVDGIMRMFSYLEDWMYEYQNDHSAEKHRRWRHFLPATFAKKVLSGEDYLNSDFIRAEFIGEHISYEVPNCGMFVLPVKIAGNWSCYFWDFEYKVITVADPTMMMQSPIKVEYNHEEYVDELHDALFACIDRFFIGWDVEKEGWFRNYPTELSPRCKPPNSGIFSTHYARSFDGAELSWKLKDRCDANLGEARAGILYFLLTMGGNSGHLPVDLLEELEMYGKRRRIK